MQRLWVWFMFAAVVGCSSPGRAEAPVPNAAGAPLQLAAPAVSVPSANETVSLELGTASEGFMCDSSSESFLMLGLRAAEIAAPDRQPMNLALVIDRSGSMQAENKLEHAKEAAQFLIRNLLPTDRVALVVYDDQVQVLAHSKEVGKDPSKLLHKIAALTPGNLTNIEGGLRAGYEEVGKNVAPNRISRVLLLSDGLANVGVSDPRELGLLAKDAAAAGMSTTAMGVGVEYSEETMMQVAEHGRGNYHFIGDANTIPQLFARELRELKATVAQDAVVSLDLPAGSVIERVYGYDQAEVGSAHLTLPIGDLWSGDNRRIVVRVRTAAGAARELTASAQVRYRSAERSMQTVAQPRPDRDDARVHLRCVGSPAEVQALAVPAVQDEVEIVTSAEVMDMAMKDVSSGRKEEAKRKLEQHIARMAPVAARSKNAALRDQVSKLQGASVQLDSLSGMAESAPEMQSFIKGNRAASKAVQKRK